MINHPPPWLRLGAEIKERELTSSWMARAGLDFEVEKKNIYYHNDQGGFDGVPNTSVLVRKDTHNPLGIVSQNRYKIVQPMDIINLYQDIAKDHDLKLEAGGALKGGKTVWALASTGRGFEIRGDRLTEYCLLSTGFDGKATSGMLITRRDSCWNTLEVAMQKGLNKVSYTHAQTFEFHTAKRDMGFLTSDNSRYIADLEKLAAHKVTDHVAQSFFAKLYFGDTAIEELTTVQQNKLQALMFIYANEPTQRDITGSLWGVVNAVTFNQDHVGRARSEDNRLTSAWFGAGRNTKNQAYEMALERAAATQL